MKLFLSILLPILVGFTAAFATRTSVKTWYLTLKKPSFTPPNILFPIIWTILYILMGISFYILWQSDTSQFKMVAYLSYFVQLFFNFMWSIIFFFYKKIRLGLIDIILLWLSIVVFLFCLYPISALGTWLQIPYLIWGTYATALNWKIVKMNPNHS